MGTLIMIGQLIAALSVLVLVHEFGHFIAARAFGIRVEKFFIFFDAGGFKLFSIKRGETEYGIGWLPLGGYVKIAGMIDESFDKEHLSHAPELWEFRSKPAWQRIIVMTAGVIMNVLLAIVVFTIMTWHYGETFIPNKELKYGIHALSLGRAIGLKDGDKIVSVNGKEVKHFSELMSPDVILSKNSKITVNRDGQLVTIQVPNDFARLVTDSGIDKIATPRATFSVKVVQKGSNADKAGLKAGDSIVAVNGQPTIFFTEFHDALQKHKQQNIDLTIYRDGNKMTLNANVDSSGILGFQPEVHIPQASEQYGLIRSVGIGAGRAWEALSTTVKGLAKVVEGDIPANKAVQGPIGIMFIFGAHWNWARFWGLTGLLSMVLALMNILPIPALDGGHVMLLIAEIIRGKELSPKVLEVTQIIGVVILLVLMVLIFGNDIHNHFFNH